LRTWHKFLTSHDSEYWVQLSPGTAVGKQQAPPSSFYVSDIYSIVVDNHRVLHGRSAFDGKRRMCGAYIGRDEYRSKLTTLAGKYSDPAFSEKTKVLGGPDTGSIWSPYV